MNHVCINGKIVPAHKPVLMPGNRGFRYGDALFETMKLVDGKIVLEKYHFERLFKGLRLLEFDISSGITPSKLSSEIGKLCRKNQCVDLARVRLSVFRGNGGLSDEEEASQYLVECRPADKALNGINKTGFKIDIYPGARKSQDMFGNLKSANFLPYVMAARYARTKKLNDCLVTNTRGNIADASIANIFLVKKNMVITPALTEGCVEGVMRRYLLEKLRGAGSFEMREGVITKNDLETFDEVFLTNALYGMRWVKKFRNKTYSNIQTLKIYAEYITPLYLKPAVNIFWFRRDLRLEDNAGLYHALKEDKPVLPLFIFDKNILDELEDKTDRRVAFIRQALQKMQAKLVNKGSTLDVRYGFPKDVYSQILKEYTVHKVFTNHDYEPYAGERDKEIQALLKKNGISFHTYKDQVIFEKNEVLKDDGTPYTVFTPYLKKWKTKLNESFESSYPNNKYFANFYKQPEKELLSLESMGFKPVDSVFPPQRWEEAIIKKYDQQRDLPGTRGTSELSVHLRFGTISIRELVREAGSLNEIYLNELVWRDFYQMILWHFPEVVSRSFKPEYDKIPWRNNEKEFSAWCRGMTGYPIVDAGMRELNAAGYMHNRARMITASFLTKHLLIDWRWGEAYFAKKLLDYDLAANNGGWQWAAGSGCDAAPYFRIFNPYLQTKKFDPALKYIRKWVPEFEEPGYPSPVVEHKFARQRCLEMYKRALRK